MCVIVRAGALCGVSRPIGGTNKTVQDLVFSDDRKVCVLRANECAWCVFFVLGARGDSGLLGAYGVFSIQYSGSIPGVDAPPM